MRYKWFTTIGQLRGYGPCGSWHANRLQTLYHNRILDCFHSQKLDSNSINDNNCDSPLNKPVSHMGVGDPKTAKRWRYLLKKAAEVKQEEKDSPLADNIPAILKIRYQQSPESLRILYPDAAKLFEENTFHQVEPSPCLDETVQYPFQVSQSNLMTSACPSEHVSEATNILHESGPHLAVSKMQKSVLKLINDLKSNTINVESDQDELTVLKEEIWRVNYGSPNPSVPPSNVPCGGCGSLLHCQDSAIPGYMPYERFDGLTPNKLRKELCQRCLFLHHYNVALNVSVPSDDYPKIISAIQQSRSLVILLVDLTDFPCSIWPGISDLVGTKKPLFVIGNKVDLLPRDSKGYLIRIEESLEQNLKDMGFNSAGNLIHVGLISAKTGYGIESLISKLHKHWAMKGDVHIVGCTNVGKSTLFNTLLQSDLCKVQASDLVQRATTSVWPGTTLNLLKFPMLRPSGYNQYLRTKRLMEERNANMAEQQLRVDMYRQTRDVKYATLIGRIGMTFEKRPGEPGFARGLEQRKSFDPNVKEFRDGRFCYDTPGAVYRDQILDLLTIKELVTVLPKEIIHPRTFTIRRNQSIFLAGIARIDCLQLETVKHSLLVTFFASPHLPVHVLDTNEADEFYKQNLGTRLLAIPFGNAERITSFPKLEGKEFHIIGEGYNHSCADVVLSSAGWCAISMENKRSCAFKAYTPEGRGIYLRQPSVLPYAVKLRGRKIRGTPAYENKLCCSLE